MWLSTERAFPDEWDTTKSYSTHTADPLYIPIKLVYTSLYLSEIIPYVIISKSLTENLRFLEVLFEQKYLELSSWIMWSVVFCIPTVA